MGNEGHEKDKHGAYGSGNGYLASQLAFNTISRLTHNGVNQHVRAHGRERDLPY
jgi:hypothetical protein